MTASLRILSSKADSNTWESFTRSELKLESVHQESPRSDIFRKRATKPLLKQKHHQKHREAQNPCCLKSNVSGVSEDLDAVTSAGVGSLCFSKSAVNAAIYQGILEPFMLPSADKLYGDVDFSSSRILAHAHTAKTTSKWFADHDITVLDWPANMPDLNPILYLLDIFKRKMRNSRSNNPDKLKAQ